MGSRVASKTGNLPCRPAGKYNPCLALLAQLAEQLTLNQRVVGSSPTQGIDEEVFRLRALGREACFN